MLTAYTALRVVPEGVVLRDLHVARLTAPFDAPARASVTERFDAFTRTAAPGIYRVVVTTETFEVEPRAHSALSPGQPVVFKRSPVAHLVGPQRKQPSPNPYDTVRTPGVTTLLTSDDETELFESCVASLVAWNDGLVLPRDTAPRVDSVSERWLSQQVPHRRAPVLRASTWPLAVVNAVAGIVPLFDDVRPFPAQAIAQLQAALTASTK